MMQIISKEMVVAAFLFIDSFLSLYASFCISFLLLIVFCLMVLKMRMLRTAVIQRGRIDLRKVMMTITSHFIHSPENLRV